MAPQGRASWMDRFKYALGLAPSLPELDDQAQEQRRLSDRLPDGTLNRPGGMFRQSDWSNLTTTRNGNGGPGQGTLPPTVSTVFQALMPTAKRSARQSRSNEMLFTLTPELKQARRILVSSILSPNDIQTGAANIVCDDKTLSAEQNLKIGTLLTEFFNEKLKLGTRLGEWIGDVLFESGAKAVVVMPKEELRTIARAGAKSSPSKFKGSNEAFTFSDFSISTEHLSDLELQSEMFQVVDGLRQSLEALKPTLGGTAKSNPDKDRIDVAAIVDYSRNFIVKMLETGPGRVTAPAVVHDPMELQKVARSQRENQTQIAAKYFANLFSHDPAATDNAWMLEASKRLGNGDEPFLVELPAESVIPVCVKGSSSTHLGYFVLLDENGDPIVPSEDASDITILTSQTLTKQAASSYLSSSTTVPTWGVLGSSDKNKLECLSAAFGIAVKHLMKQSLKRNGIISVDVGPYNAISNCIFFNMMANNKVKLLYIPEPMMIYYAFDYHKDGTGKSLIEGIEYVLSLRSTLFVAYVMSVIQSAVVHRTVKVDVDDKNVEFESMIHMIREMMVAKDVLPFDNNPSAISRNLANRHISIIPKNIKGIPGGFEIEKDLTVGRSASINADVLDLFNNMWMSGVSIPHNLFNALGENEYMRSIAVNNLYFSNDIRVYQSKLEDPNARLVRNYTAASTFLREEIRRIVRPESVKKQTEDEPDALKRSTPGEVSVKADGKTPDTDTDEQVDTAVLRAILSLRIALPLPNITVSKAQFEELIAYIDSLDKVLDAQVSEDMYNVQGANLTDTIKQIRALIKSTLVRQFIARMGLSVCDIPPLDELIRKNDGTVVNGVRALTGYREMMRHVVTPLNTVGGQGGGSESTPVGGGAFGEPSSDGGDVNTPEGKALEVLPKPPSF